MGSRIRGSAQWGKLLCWRPTLQKGVTGVTKRCKPASRPMAFNGDHVFGFMVYGSSMPVENLNRTWTWTWKSGEVVWMSYQVRPLLDHCWSSCWGEIFAALALKEVRFRLWIAGRKHQVQSYSGFSATPTAFGGRVRRWKGHRQPIKTAPSSAPWKKMQVTLGESTGLV